MKKRLFSIFLALCMLLCFMPAGAFADGGELGETFYLDDGVITIVVAEESTFAVVEVDGAATQVYGTVVITQRSATTTNCLEIDVRESSYTLNVVLEGVNIVMEDFVDDPPVTVKGVGDTVITLVGKNYVKSGTGICAGIQKEGTGKLTITAADTNQSLTAISGSHGAAGIGGRTAGDNVSNITISGGTIDARGGREGAGIGGGFGGSGSNITITGGRVIATGGNFAAGIGGGNQGNSGEPGDGSNITITGGEVIATGGDFAAGIGGGTGGNGSNITISGGRVTARSSSCGAGIGGGYRGTGNNITVSGSAQLKVQGGNKTSSVGAGAPIGNGGDNIGNNTPVDGAEVTPDTDALTVCGKIEYYAPDVDMAAAAPFKTVDGTAGSHIFVHHEAKAATCTQEGNAEYWYCSVCERNYGDENGSREIADVITAKNPDNHSGTLAWLQTATTHEQKWNCCDVVAVAQEPHEWEDGECGECGYACLHEDEDGDDTCDICGKNFGSDKLVNALKWVLGTTYKLIRTVVRLAVAVVKWLLSLR